MLVFFGASHHTLDLSTLEQLSAGSDKFARVLLEGPSGATGAVTLATCNRVEMYVDTPNFHDCVETAAEGVARITGMSTDDVSEVMEVRVGSPAVSHLYSVASGLDSMVVGESEIAGQVRKALASARLNETTTPLLERVFQSASRISRKVSSTTGIGASGRSIVAVGLDIAAEQIGSLAGRRALIIGTGAYARVSATALGQHEIGEIGVYSASGRADKFAENHDVIPVDDAGLEQWLAESDVVLTSSGVHGTLLDASNIGSALELRRSHFGAAGSETPPLPIIDLSLPRDVSTEAANLPGVSIIDLAVIQEHSPSEHIAAVAHAEQLVTEAAGELEEEISARALVPAVVALRRHVDNVLENELDRVRGSLDEASAAQVERSLRRMAGTLLHKPTVRAREVAKDGEHDSYTQALHTLFGIDLDKNRPHG